MYITRNTAGLPVDTGYWSMVFLKPACALAGILYGLEIWSHGARPVELTCSCAQVFEDRTRSICDAAPKTVRGPYIYTPITVLLLLGYMFRK